MTTKPVDTVQIPEVWYKWVEKSKQENVSTDKITKVLKANGFSNQIIHTLLNSKLDLKMNKKKTSLTNDWKEWIAINLSKGICEEIITNILLENGFNRSDIEDEVRSPTTNPYIGNVSEADKLLAKRNWLIETFDTLAQLDPSYNQEIDVIDTPDFSYFIKHYYSKNKPVVLKGGIDHWPALQKWTPQYFAEKFGDTEIQVQSNRESDALFERNSVKHRKFMKMSEYVDLIENGGDSNDYYMTANNTQQNIKAIKSAFADLGDFGKGYRNLTDDPTFSTYFWLGPKGVFTPLHHDLTNNMLVQIYGSKKVTLIPALQVPYIYNDLHVYSQVPFPEVDLSTHPLMSKVTPVEVLLEAGDALFIPIAWWHCVHGLDKSISISFTNFNAPNNFSDSFCQIGA